MGRRRIRVLVVEDDANWREALCFFYEQHLSLSSPIVESAGNGPDALRRLRTERFDLLSLDINLGLTHPLTDEGLPDLAISGAEGRTVLRRAYEWKACNGVIVITGLHYDNKLRLVMPDETERGDVKMTLASYLDKLFPSRNLYLQKNLEMSISKCIEVYKNSLSYEQLIHLCEVSTGMAPPYSIDVSGSLDGPRILVRSKRDPEDIVRIKHTGDAKLLYSLAYIRKSGECVTKEMACAIYRGQQVKGLAKSDLSRYADVDINSFRRRLRKLGLSPDELFVIERNVDEKKRGWRLHPDVNIRGIATVDARSKVRIYSEDIADPNSLNPWDLPRDDPDSED